VNEKQNARRNFIVAYIIIISFVCGLAGYAIFDAVKKTSVDGANGNRAITAGFDRARDNNSETKRIAGELGKEIERAEYLNRNALDAGRRADSELQKIIVEVENRMRNTGGVFDCGGRCCRNNDIDK
jgi:hypothetical protein